MLTPDQIDDFANLTLSRFKRNKWTDISLEHTEYISAKLVTEKRVFEQGGKNINFKVQKSNTGTAHNTGLYDTDQTAVEDVTTEGTVPWAYQTGNWSYDVREDDFQSDQETIVKLLQLREHDCMNSLHELNEENLWSAPTGTSDTRPMGIPFWIQKDATTTPGGAFNGGNPTGFTSGAAGIDSTVYTKWKNWTFGYTNVSLDDYVDKVKFALYKTNFQAPDPHPELAYGKSDYFIYTVYDVRKKLETLAESRNDSLGSDVAKFIGMVTVGGVPLKAVPYLDANDSSDPSYGVNWRVFRPFVKRNWDMKRTMKAAPKQRHVREVHYDTAMNYCCYNRRFLWVGSKA